MLPRGSALCLWFEAPIPPWLQLGSLRRPEEWVLVTFNMRLLDSWQGTRSDPLWSRLLRLPDVTDEKEDNRRLQL